MFNSWRYMLSIAACSLIVGTILYWRTDGFQSFTYETARRNSIQNIPVLMSDWQLENAQSQKISLDSFEDTLLVVDFIYTRCPTICRALGSRYQQLQQLIDTEQIDDVILLSISIDPEFDSPAMLNRYQAANKGVDGSWKLARPTNLETLQAIMADTGLRVIPDEIGGFAHSESLHFIKNRLLSRIDDWDSPDVVTKIRRGGNS